MNRIPMLRGPRADAVALEASLILVGFGIVDELTRHYVSGGYILAVGVAGSLLAGLRLRRRARGEPDYKQDWTDTTSPSIRRQVFLIGVGFLIAGVYMAVLAVRDFSRGSYLMGIVDLVGVAAALVLLIVPLVVVIRRCRSR